MRYVQGLAVAVLIVVGYLVVQGGVSTPMPTPSPAPPSTFDFGVPVVASATPGPPHFDTLSPTFTFPPFGAQLSPPPAPRPTHHVLHSGPPLH